MEHSHVLQLACPPMPVVRIGFVGLGNRGMATLRRYLVIDGVQIVALCDINQAHLAEAASLLHVDGNIHLCCWTQVTGGNRCVIVTI